MGLPQRHLARWPFRAIDQGEDAQDSQAVTLEAPGQNAAGQIKASRDGRLGENKGSLEPRLACADVPVDLEVLCQQCDSV